MNEKSGERESAVLDVSPFWLDLAKGGASNRAVFRTATETVWLFGSAVIRFPANGNYETAAEVTVVALSS